MILKITNNHPPIQIIKRNLIFIQISLLITKNVIINTQNSHNRIRTQILKVISFKQIKLNMKKVNLISFSIKVNKNFEVILNIFQILIIQII